MSKIREILNDNNSVLVFDIDGVLATMEWGEYNHFAHTEEEWANMYKTEGTYYYTKEFACKRMQEFLKDKDKSRVYVITKAYSDNEWKDKINFSYECYNIPKDHVFYVDDNAKKVDVLNEIRKKHPEVDEHHIVMIDDTTEVLNSVRDNTDYTTAHISSFLNF